jgi:3-oxoacyl-[acyl-carrier protein] reductase
MRCYLRPSTFEPGRWLEGIGRSIAERLAADGARVVIWELTPQHFDRGADDFHPEAVLAVDVAESTSVDNGFGATLDVLGCIDIFVTT